MSLADLTSVASRYNICDWFIFLSGFRSVALLMGCVRLTEADIGSRELLQMREL